MYDCNANAREGHDGGKCRSLLFSQQQASHAVFGISHKAGKLIYSYNPCKSPASISNISAPSSLHNAIESTNQDV